MILYRKEDESEKPFDYSKAKEVFMRNYGHKKGTLGYLKSYLNKTSKAFKEYSLYIDEDRYAYNEQKKDVYYVRDNKAHELFSSTKWEDCIDFIDNKICSILANIIKEPIKESKNPMKTRFDLIPPIASGQIARVLTFGAAKYGANDWMRGLAYTVVYGAIMRHLTLWFAGEDRDKESGELHLAHAAANLMFLIHYSATRTGEDDRPITNYSPF